MKNSLFVKMIICLFCVTLYSGAVSFTAYGSAKVIDWTKNYGSVSPLNFTIGYSSFSEFPNTPPIFVLEKDEIEKIIKHWSVGIFEMTNGAHMLGRIKIIEHDKEELPEPYHIEWKLMGRDTRSNAGAYIPYKQF